MPKPNWLVIVRRSSCSELPRAHICIRAVHHIFHSNNELMDAEADESPGPPTFQTPSLSKTANR
jgi:hypothetical protein